MSASLRGWAGCLWLYFVYLDRQVYLILQNIFRELLLVARFYVWTSLCGFFVSFQLNWKIEVKKDKFTFTNTFKKKKTYKFDEIEVRELRACYRYYHNGKHIVGILMLLDDFYMLSEAIAAYRAKKKKEGEIQ